ncbi:rhodanese-like domain-containing protein [Amphibacillus sediminis]|uniref:rhodanese-like domain-containing protein n=1 Tax=Amphibacillus sediminis TaxID=360185 RepID=UPI00278BD789|nr:rhodanese-like domain-containing protein [Amphibacillus sediminis]
MNQITSADLAAKIAVNQSLNIIDVRESHEVAVGKIPTARHVPMNHIPAYLDQLDPNQHYYVICRSGKRSGQVVEYLTELGYQATNVADGMLAWTGDIKKAE